MTGSEIHRLLEEGIGRAEIARRLGVDSTTVTRYALRHGFGAVAPRPSKYDWEAIRTYYEAGHTRAECKVRFGFSEGAWDRAVSRGDIVPGEIRWRRPRGETRRLVKELWDSGKRPSEIAEELRLPRPTVSYHLRKLGVAASRFGRRFDWHAIQKAHDAGLSVRQCAAKFGFSTSSWHNAVKRGEITPRLWVIPIEELLVVGRRTSRSHLKARLINEGLKENRCEECGISEWRGRALSIELHHVNGKKLDNRLENLRMLCGNCHSQTHTWGGRNLRRGAAA